jgi:hypothetical protein
MHSSTVFFHTPLYNAIWLSDAKFCDYFDRIIISFKLRGMYSYVDAAWMLYIEMKSSRWENWKHFFYSNVSLLTDPTVNL